MFINILLLQVRPAESIIPPEQRNLMLVWEEKIMVTNSMWDMGRGAACVIGILAYFNPGATPDIYCFDYCSKQWSELPECPTCNFALVIVNDLLTTVGGEEEGDKLFSFSDEGKWVEEFTPMPTKREYPAAVCTGHSLVVAGGRDEGKDLPTVEVMDTNTLQWFTAASLPSRRIGLACMTVCGDNLYLLGDATIRVYSCSIQALLQTCQAPGRVSTLQQASVWNRGADLPVKWSTAATLCGQLVSVGGTDDEEVAVNSVYCYDPVTTTWKIIGQIPSCKEAPLVTTLPGDKLIIVYGDGDGDSEGDCDGDVTIDIASAKLS